MTKDDGEMVEEQKKKPCRFWIWALSSVLFRLILISYAGNLNLSSRPEVSTPLTSIRRRISSSISLSPSLITTSRIANSPYILWCFFFCSCWRLLVEAGINVTICRFLFQIWSSLVSDFRLKLKSYLCLRRIYVSWLTVAALASRTSHGSEVSCWNQFKWSETLFQLSRV